MRASRRILKTTPWILATAIGLNDFALEITPVQGSSMAPTLSPAYATTGAQDYLAWRKWMPTADLRRGDIVMYNTPLRAEGTAVKRVVALGGDVVYLDARRRPGAADSDGRVRASERTAVKGWDVMAAAGSDGREAGFRVPYGHVWCEGDNWRASLDSNFFGPMSRSLIVGKAVGVVWPVGRWGVELGEGGAATAAAGVGVEKGDGDEVFFGRTRVVKGREEVPQEWEDLVRAGF